MHLIAKLGYASLTLLTEIPLHKILSTMRKTVIKAQQKIHLLYKRRWRKCADSPENRLSSWAFLPIYIPDLKPASCGEDYLKRSTKESDGTGISRVQHFQCRQSKVEQWIRWHALSVNRLSFVASLAISKTCKAQNIEDSLGWN